MYVGVDYYPEHWPVSRWQTDASLMKKAGLNVVRLAEFAWINMEPEEGVYTFDWLDKALAILHKNGISAMLGTPTASMPAWVRHKYPEVMSTNKDGRRIAWGMRKNNCFTSGTYRLLSERIVRAMAGHFAKTPNVIGWQTDNEFGSLGNICYCPSCLVEFQDFLRSRYQTLDNLNRAWGTHFWGQSYRKWDEIVIPDDIGAMNPGACLDWKRFHSWLNVRFQRDQVKILRQVCPRHFVTHNLMGFYDGLVDYYDLAEDLDVVSWDNYPLWEGHQSINYSSVAAADLMRGIKRKNVWVMELAAGPCGWGIFGRNPQPGEIRKIAYQHVAHGADAIVWFRWRTCTAGREQYWHGLLGHDGKPRRRYHEAARTAGELHRLAPLLAGTTVKPDVAVIYDYQSLWATQIQPSFDGNEYRDHLLRYCKALARTGLNLDMIRPTENFSQYKIVIAPQLYLLPDSVAKALNDFVRKGGVLLVDIRTGVKDQTGICYDRTLPGRLSPSLGIVIEEYESLNSRKKETEYEVVGKKGMPGNFTACGFADWIKPRKAEVLAGYLPPHVKNYATLTKHRYGRGYGYYLGAVIKEETFYDALIAEMARTAGVKPLLPKLPLGVDLSVRQGRGKKLLFLVNHTIEKRSVSMPRVSRELLTAKNVGKVLDLPPLGVAVVELRARASRAAAR